MFPTERMLAVSCRICKLVRCILEVVRYQHPEEHVAPPSLRGAGKTIQGSGSPESPTLARAAGVRVQRERPAIVPIGRTQSE